MKLTYIKQAGEPNGDAGDQYTGLDRFGRVVDQRWPEGSDELERVDYGFTAASNRQWRQNLVAAGGQDEYYNYDGLYQVAELNRGTLNGGKTGIAGTPSWTEDFTYDPIGNWDAYLTKVSGVTDLDQTRTHNTANETVEIDGSTDTVAHDLAGNMTMVPQVADWESTFELKWDAWNRLVEVVDGETTVAQYRYDGKTRRVSKETDATRHYFYSDQWQIVEERVDEETAAERQFLWGQRYLDDLVLRDRDVDADGSLDERLYVLSDYFNPTAIADEDGVVLERYGYNAFGLSRVMDADFEPRSTSDYDWETRYGAYRYDAETGFYQVRYRSLHPTLGRWLRRDPAGERGRDGANLYTYVRNSSLKFVDYYGLAAIPVIPILKAVADCGIKFLAPNILKRFDQAKACGELSNRLQGMTTDPKGKDPNFENDLCGGYSFNPRYESDYTPMGMASIIAGCIKDKLKGESVEKALEKLTDPVKKKLLDELLNKAIEDSDVEAKIVITVRAGCVDGKASVTISYTTVLSSGKQESALGGEAVGPFGCGGTTLFTGRSLDSFCCKGECRNKKKN